jgi:hypothetical protein
VAEQDFVLGPGYRIVPFADQDAIGPEDLVEFWTRERALARPEAERRVSEALLIGLDDQGELAGVSTVYLRENVQLRAEFWYVRAFVGAAHRRSNIATTLAVSTREHMVERFRSGAEPAGLGLIFEIENEVLKRVFPEAHWMPTDFLFIGENARGDHVRVHYFPGVHAPEPDQGRA